MKMSRFVPVFAAVFVIGLQSIASAQDAPAAPAAAGVLSVRSFGAAGDGKQLDAPAINKAIDAAAAKGGGMVFFPAGDYLSTSIRLKSNVSLYLDQGATIVAADPKAGVLGDAVTHHDFDTLFANADHDQPRCGIDGFDGTTNFLLGWR